MTIIYPVIPNTITVHLGAPNDNSKDITILFTDYIKNVASSEIYPTWPYESLKANIRVIINFALNRIYNEWYRSKGYNFDITSSPAYDQKYTLNKGIYSNISNIVDSIYFEYIVKGNQIQPLFTSYCDGRNTTCNGLSQWGSVSLANSNKTDIEILKYYYGNDIIIKTGEISDVKEYYPGYDLKLGSVGNPVLIIERALNRISDNYPAIPKIKDTLGIYLEETKDAVSKFQQIFLLPVSGIVYKATWYKIRYVFNSVSKLSELYTEGLNLEDVTFLYNDQISYGDKGIEVKYIAYFLSSLAFFNNNIPNLKIGDVFDNNMLTMYNAFQKEYNLKESDTITYRDWKVLRKAYDDLLTSYPESYKDWVMKLYPDYFLVYGNKSNDIKRYQMFLYEICKKYKNIPGVRVNGIFDDLTLASVKKIQKDNNIDVTGVVGPITWDKTVELASMD